MKRMINIKYSAESPLWAAIIFGKITLTQKSVICKDNFTITVEKEETEITKKFRRLRNGEKIPKDAFTSGDGGATLFLASSSYQGMVIDDDCDTTSFWIMEE